jgi:hypothetical protein
MEEANSTLHSGHVSPSGLVPVLSEEIPVTGFDGLILRFPDVLGGTLQTMDLDTLNGGPALEYRRMKFAHRCRAVPLR